MYVEMVSGGQPFTAGRVCFSTLLPGYYDQARLQGGGTVPKGPRVPMGPASLRTPRRGLTLNITVTGGAIFLAKNAPVTIWR